MKKFNFWNIIGSLFLGTIKFKLDNKYWYFHKGDNDINPSYPHLHSKDNKYKMNIYIGDIYLIKQKNPFATLSDKEHKKLWADTKFVNYVIQIRKNYIYGEDKLPDIPYSYIGYKRLSYFE